MVNRPFEHSFHADAQNLKNLESFCAENGIEIFYLQIPVPAFYIEYEYGQKKLFINNKYSRWLPMAFEAVGMPLELLSNVNFN
jgi:hypothetical protein